MNARALKMLAATKLLPLLLLLALPAVAQAQFYYTNSYGIWSYTPNTGPVTITRVTNIPLNGVVVIPDTINGYPVTGIAFMAFAAMTNLTSITIGNNVTSIGEEAFFLCHNLTGVTIPSSVTSIGDNAFNGCGSLTGVTIPSSVTNIGEHVFLFCTNLTSVRIGKGLTSMGSYAFQGCSNLTAIYFQGNPPTPTNNLTAFLGDTNGIVYYLPGTTGWGATFGGLPTVLWNPQAQTGDGSFGVLSNQFGFNITGSSNLVIVVEASTNLMNSSWIPVATNTLIGGTFYFSDPQWTNYPARFYRLSSP